jgi:hypothetical protein
MRSFLSTPGWLIPRSARRALLDNDTALGEDAALCDAVAGSLGIHHTHTDNGGSPSAAAAAADGEVGATPSPAGKHEDGESPASSGCTLPAERFEAGENASVTPQVFSPRDAREGPAACVLLRRFFSLLCPLARQSCC